MSSQAKYLAIVLSLKSPVFDPCRVADLRHYKMISTGGKVYTIHWPSLQDYFVDIPMHRRDGDLRTMQHGQMHSEFNTNKIYLIRFHPGDIHWPFLASSIVKTMCCVEASPPVLRLSIRI